jgi:hypothetical protein
MTILLLKSRVMAEAQSCCFSVLVSIIAPHSSISLNSLPPFLFHFITSSLVHKPRSHNFYCNTHNEFVKMTFSSLVLCTLLLLAAPFAAVGHTMVYTAELEPLFGDSQVTGKVVVFTSHNGITVAYSGSVAGLEQDGTDSTCASTAGVNGKYSYTVATPVKRQDSRSR